MCVRCPCGMPRAACCMGLRPVVAAVAAPHAAAAGVCVCLFVCSFVCLLACRLQVDNAIPAEPDPIVRPCRPRRPRPRQLSAETTLGRGGRRRRGLWDSVGFRVSVAYPHEQMRRAAQGTLRVFHLLKLVGLDPPPPHTPPHHPPVRQQQAAALGRTAHCSAPAAPLLHGCARKQ